MGHLVAHVLPEAHARGVGADARHELLDAGHEVAQGLVGDRALKGKLTIVTRVDYLCMFRRLKKVRVGNEAARIKCKREKTLGRCENVKA